VYLLSIEVLIEDQLSKSSPMKLLLEMVSFVVDLEGLSKSSEESIDLIFESICKFIATESGSKPFQEVLLCLAFTESLVDLLSELLLVLNCLTFLVSVWVTIKGLNG
jgi:hypothetical protein